MLTNPSPDDWSVSKSFLFDSCCMSSGLGSKLLLVKSCGSCCCFLSGFDLCCKNLCVMSCFLVSKIFLSFIFLSRQLSFSLSLFLYSSCFKSSQLRLSLGLFSQGLLFPSFLLFNGQFLLGGLSLSFLQKYLQMSSDAVILFFGQNLGFVIF